MADTQRSTAALLALLADNATGEISPQDVRDALVSVLGGYGSIYVSGGASAQALDTTPAKLTMFDADGLASGTTPAHASDLITIDVDGVYDVECVLNGFGVATTVYTFNLTKNTTPEAEMQARYTTTGTEDFTVVIRGRISCVATDTISVYGASDNGGGANFTLVNGQLNVKRVG